MYGNTKLNRGPQTGKIKHRVHAYFSFIIYANKRESSVSERLRVVFFTSLPGAKGGLSRRLIHTTAVSTQELRTNLLYEFIAATYAALVRDKPAAAPKPISAFPVPTSSSTGFDPLQQHGSPCPTRVLRVCEAMEEPFTSVVP